MCLKQMIELKENVFIRPITLCSEYTPIMFFIRKIQKEIMHRKMTRGT